MKSTVVACSNLALIKYWGNRDDTLNIPINDSISVSLEDLQTTTTVEFGPKHADSLVLNGDPAKGEAKQRFEQFISHFRKLTGFRKPVRVESVNNFPTAAGIASSSSGFGALSHALYDAAGFEYQIPEISKLARLGSGSAARSPIAGYAHWYAGKDHETSFATQLALADDMRILVVLTDQSEKFISSIDAMQLSKRSSPFFTQRGVQSNKNISQLKQAIEDHDFSLLGKISQQEANNLHAVINTTGLGLYYWNPTSLAIMKYVNVIREEYEIPCYYTIDAGPQIKILMKSDQANAVQELVEDKFSMVEIISTSIGFGSKLSDLHLF